MKNPMFKSCLASVTLLIGVSIYALGSIPVIARTIVSLETHNDSIANILSGYAFTVAGFLATIATFLFTFGDRPYFQLYKRRGSFGELMFLHGLALVVLGSIFAISLLLLASPAVLRLALTLTVLSLLQLTFLTFISYSLSRRSQGDR